MILPGIGDEKLSAMINLDRMTNKRQKNDEIRNLERDESTEIFLFYG